jgi:glycerol-1-phosphate dehydrogenase [NAD(P)+]
MEPHIVVLPRRLVIGNGVLDKMGEDYETLGLSGRPLVLVDRTTREIAGKRVMDALAKWKPASEDVEDSTMEEVDRITDVARDFGAIVSVGGGKIIDVGKVAAYGLNRPFISVPTAPSHDGIASERASITAENGKSSVRATPPLAVVADVQVLMKAPSRMIASGAADVLSNLTSVTDWKLARNVKKEYYSDYSAYLAKSSAKTVLKFAEQIGSREEKGIRHLMEALLTSSISMSMAGSSRPASGAEHAFSHALDNLGSRGMHGEQCGLGAIMMSRLQGKDWRLIRDALKTVGAPVAASEAGIPEEMVIDALTKAGGIRDRYTILNRKPLDRESAEKLARETGVI